MIDATSRRFRRGLQSIRIISVSSVMFLSSDLAVYAQAEFEAPLCQAAKEQQVIQLVYDKDISKGCEPRIVDVHQVAIGKNGQLYMRGWQSRGCTKGRDFEAVRTYRFDKIKSVNPIDGSFGDKSAAKKQEGWNGCLGNNCFIEKNICE